MAKCEATWIGGYAVVIECVQQERHAPPHRTRIGQEWDDVPQPTDSETGAQS